MADHIIILNDKGEIGEQGTWEELRAQEGYIRKVVLREREDADDRPKDRAEERDQVVAVEEKPDNNMQDMTRKTGDTTLYGEQICVAAARKLELTTCRLLFQSHWTLQALPSCCSTHRKRRVTRSHPVLA